VPALEVLCRVWDEQYLAEVGVLRCQRSNQTEVVLKIAPAKSMRLPNLACRTVLRH
jgi:hypothetical protein